MSTTFSALNLSSYLARSRGISGGTVKDIYNHSQEMNHLSPRGAKVDRSIRRKGINLGNSEEKDLFI